MDAHAQHLMAQSGYAYIRNLIAAEAAVRRGEFKVAKMLRVSAYVHRALAMQLARSEDDQATPTELFRTNLSEFSDFDQMVASASDTNRDTSPLLDQIAQNQKRVSELIQQSVRSLENHADIQDSDVALVLWVCLSCGFVAEENRPDTCTVCGAVGAEFAWFGPFYVETPEHLGRMTPAQILSTLETIPQEIAQLTSDVSDEMLSHRPSEEEWCVKEIMGHLVEIDRLFAKRAATLLERTDIPDLSSPGFPWQIHEGKGYEQLPIQELLDLWEQARSTSLAIIRNLTSEQWSRRGTLREMTTSLIDLGFWLANHDLGHCAQIRRLCGK